MQEISSITSPPAPTEPAKARPAEASNSFANLLEALCGIEEPAPAAPPGVNEAAESTLTDKAPNSPASEKDATPIATLPNATQDVPAASTEILIREIQELTRDTAPPRELPVDSPGGLKKPALSTKPSAPQAPIDSSAASRLTVDTVGQFLAIPVSVASIKKPSPEQPDSVMPSLEIRTLSSIPSLAQPVTEKLNLEDFNVTRFEYKIETDTGSSEAQFRLLPELQAELMLRNSISARENKTAKPPADFAALTRDSSASQQAQPSSTTIVRSEAVQKVQLVFEPPPAPPTVRRVAMDIGDAESQVRVVIQERNGNLNVQFGAANERLRQDLQTSGPLLMRELQRDNPMPVRLDFSNFGSATEADRRSRFQWPEKKTLKPGAEFADAAETARLSSLSSVPKSL